MFMVVFKEVAHTWTEIDLLNVRVEVMRKMAFAYIYIYIYIWLMHTMVSQHTLHYSSPPKAAPWISRESGIIKCMQNIEYRI